MSTQPALPTYHIRPRSGWLNDPNGVALHEGTWHVFFQHNPKAAVHDAIAWGHVSSEDLVTWRDHPVAFAPTPEGPDQYGCWTGAFVPGLERPTMVYSGVVDTTFQSTICLREALDDNLDTWSDPVVVGTTPDTDDIEVMRDPFTFLWGGRRWAVLGASLTGGRPAVLLFGCDDVRAWTYEGILYADTSLTGQRWPADTWECPQLVLADGRAVIVVSNQLEGRLGEVIAVVGDLVDDAGRPRFVAATAELLDDGDVMYAPQFACDPTPTVHFGWVRQEGVPADRYDGATDLLAGCLTLPRVLRVEGDRVVVTRHPATDGLLTSDGRLLTDGDHELPRTCRLTTSAGGTLNGTDGDIDVPEASGTEIWIDGEVVEIYPGDGSVPRTYRQVGTLPWRLTTTHARVDDVRPHATDAPS